MFEKALQGVQVDAWESLRTTDVDERAAVLGQEGSNSTRTNEL